MYDAFISHSSKDKEKIVLELVQELEKRNINVWLDANEILAGDTILDAVEKGVNAALCTILIITPSFFKSFWTPIEIGLVRSKANMNNLIPVLCNVTVEYVAQKFPTLLTLKYIKLDTNNISDCANELCKTITIIKEKYEQDFPTILFRKVVKKFNSYDIPVTNKISILLSDYEQIVKINVSAAILHTSQIASIIIDDLFSRFHTNNKSNIAIIEKLKLLKTSCFELDESIYKNLEFLITPNVDPNISPLLTNDPSQRKLVEKSMTSILEWYSKYLFHDKMIPNDKFEIVWSNDLKYTDFITMYEIDCLVLREDLIALPQITYTWYQYNNYTHIAIRSIKTKKIIGYFTVLPVTDQLYESIQSGYFKDNDLDTTNLRKYDVPDFYKLYIACVCIHPDYQNTSAFKKLYDALLEMMMELAIEREIYITNIITEASTLQGEKFCKIIGLKQLLNTQINTKIYGATLLPPSLQLKSSFGNKLIKYYKEKYEEFKDLF